MENAAEINQLPPEAAPDQINVRENMDDIPIMAQRLTRDRLDVKGKKHPHKKQQRFLQLNQIKYHLMHTHDIVFQLHPLLLYLLMHALIMMEITST